MIKVEQRYSGQYWISKPGQVTYTAGAAEAAKLLNRTIEEVRGLVVAVVEMETEAAA